MRIGFLAAAAAIVLASCTPRLDDAVAAEAPTVVGVASVIDGDTLEIRGERIRLYGVDAFESGQRCRDKDQTRIRCGRLSAMALDALVSGRLLTCTEIDRDRYDRMVARCATNQTPDLSAALVDQGWALAYRRYSQRYVSQEENARAQARGAWAGAFDDPAEWRAGRRTPAST